MTTSKRSFTIIVLSLLASATWATAATTWFTTALDGGEGSDPDGRGVAVIGIGDDTLTYFVRVDDVAAPTASHVHAGGAGASGGVVVGLSSTFTAAGDGYLASGAVALDAATRTTLLAAPAAFYVNVHTAEHPAGAVRGQVLGGGPLAGALRATLDGRRHGGDGDPNGAGFALIAFADGAAEVFLAVDGVDQPTAAHIHTGAAGRDGGVLLDLAAAFADGLSLATVEVTPELAHAVLAAPEQFYVNVHSSDHPVGAVRGQLQATESSAFFPIISRAQGQAGSAWRTDLRVLSLDDQERSLWAEWYPANDTGLTAPAATTRLILSGGAAAVVDDAVATLFAANGNGALRLVAPDPFAATARIFNDQRNNPAIGGTFGQSAPAFAPTLSGSLLLAANQAVADGGFRANLGWFNPTSEAVEVTVSARTAGGELLGDDLLTLAPYANRIKGVFQVVSSVPEAERALTDFFVTFAASAPVLAYLSVVDNVTNDAIFITPLPLPPPPVPATPANSPPDGTITAPAGDVAVTVGEVVSFAGAASDADGDEVTAAWDFGDGSTATGLVAGDHFWSTAGAFTVTFTVTDSQGAVDPTPDTRTVTVTAANRAPEGTITAPAGDVAINAGETVSFAGSGSDPEGDALSFHWDFGDGITSDQQSPGDHTFATAGSFVVRFTVSDAHGLADPTPDTRTITVIQASTATFTRVQTEIFSQSCAFSGCHAGASPAQGMNLSAGQSYALVVNVPSMEQPTLDRIEPGDPASSYLFRKVSGEGNIVGSPMPLGGPSLDAALIELLREWIQRGAPND